MNMVELRLPIRNYQDAMAGINIDNGIRNQETVINAIARIDHEATRLAAQDRYLAKIHKEIAIIKIHDFLEREPTVARENLPVRTVAMVTAAGDTLQRSNGNDFREYEYYIRIAENNYSEARLNNFVQEIRQAKEQVIQVNA